MSLPPDLRVLCRRLTSTPPSQLPHSLPAFVRHILRCGDVLSLPQDPKAKGGSPEAAMLVHKLKSIIGSLIKGKNSAGRFAGVVLAKAVVDVGGWECLRESGSWVEGLLSILKKNDPSAVKELCVVTLVRIYTLVNEYQTLAREIATRTLTAFFDACLQLIKPPTPGQRLKTPFVVVETILDAFSTLHPLYPTTCRPYNAKIRAAIRPFLAPTSSDDVLVPRSLQRASRRLAISLHFTTAGKTGPSEEWAKAATNVLRDFHETADYVFRAVQESWEPLIPRTRASVNFDGPAEQADAPDGLPGWKGVRAGSDRLIGLLHFSADLLRYPTKTPVAIPIGALMEAVHRVAQISKTSQSQSWEQALETHPAVGREEKEELWSSVPGIHLAVLDLLVIIFRRLGRNAVALVPEALDSVLLVLRSGIKNSLIRTAAYRVVDVLLQISGPGLSKTATDAISVVMLACCRDLQQDVGYLVAQAKPEPANSADAKKNGMTANADLFLPSNSGEGSSRTAKHDKLSKEHRVAAEALLASLLTNLPQRQVKPGIRGLLDQTAILSQSRDGMLASVLNPYINDAGKSYPSILPHLSRRFPHDQGVEILRSNIRVSVQVSADDVRLAAGIEELDEEEREEEEEGAVAAEGKITGDGDEEMVDGVPRDAPQAGRVEVAAFETSETRATRTQDGPFLQRQTSTTEVVGSLPAAQKRKHEGVVETTPPMKKRDTEGISAEAPIVSENKESGDGGNVSDDESVHLNMDIDDLEDDEDDEDDE